MIHGAGIAVPQEQGEGHIGLAFSGPSGAGKTTISRWFQQQGRAVVLSDERILVWKEQGRWRVGGTPWHGELHEVSPLTAPLARFFLLEKAPQNRFIPVSAGELVRRVACEAFIPLWSRERMENLVDNISSLSADLECGWFQCVNGPSVVAEALR